MAKRVKSKKYPGVYWRTTANGDKVFDICYKVNGRIHWEKVGKISEGYTAHQAAQIRAERIRQSRHPEFTPKRIPTLAEVYHKYISDKGKTLSPRSIPTRMAQWNHLKLLADLSLNEITPAKLTHLLTEWRKNGLSEPYIKSVLAFLGTLYRYAIRLDMYDGPNPTVKVEKPKFDNKRIRFLSPEEAQLLLEESKNFWAKDKLWLHDICLLALHTGMRKSEILNLKYSQLDFNNNVIVLPNQKNKTTGHVYMSGPVREMLIRRMESRTSEYVFPNPHTGKPTNYLVGFSSLIKRLGFNDGITDSREKVVFHTLRHTYASWLAMAGTPIFTIKELMRHKNIAMTTRYSHLAPDTKQDAIKAVFG